MVDVLTRNTPLGSNFHVTFALSDFVHVPTRRFLSTAFAGDPAGVPAAAGAFAGAGGAGSGGGGGMSFDASFLQAVVRQTSSIAASAIVFIRASFHPTAFAAMVSLLRAKLGTPHFHRRGAFVTRSTTLRRRAPQA